MNPETPLNNPVHPCPGCSEPIPITDTHCDEACANLEDMMRKFLAITEDFCWERAFNANAA